MLMTDGLAVKSRPGSRRVIPLATGSMMFRSLCYIPGLALMAMLLPLWSQEHPTTHRPGVAAIGSGRHIFTSACAGCHGLDGRGGERAPNLTAPEVRRLSDRELSGIVSDGIRGTAMPAFHSLRRGEIRELLHYLRVLQGERPPAKIPGDPVRGRSLFFGKARCSSCHMIHGEGGFIAMDLSAYGRDHSSAEILHSIESPSSDAQLSGKLVTLITADGRKYSGVVRNEDNFSLQLQSMDGIFHLFTKSKVRRVEYGVGPLMPGNYGSLLTRKELDDIVSYVMENTSAKKPMSRAVRKNQK
jgi:putative heme-binding domain-containing protein